MRLEQEVNIFAKDAIKRRFLAAETSVSVTQGKIAALISESEIQELQNSGTTMYSKLGKLDLNISGLTQQYSEMATKYDSVTEQYTALDSKLAEYKTSVDGLSADISQVSTRLNDNYSTTEAMNTAIKAAKDEISLSVSKTYVTTTTLSSTEQTLTKKAQGYASDAQTAAINSANINTSNTLKSYSTTTEMQAAIKAATDEISLSVSKTYVTSEILSSTKSDLDKQAKNYASSAESSANANTDKLLKNYATSSDLNSAKDRVSTLESWKQEASVKITDSAIVATVTKSTEWSNKADKSSLISQINMSSEGIGIKSSLIKLEGIVTANNYFKINSDGSMETKSAVIGGWKVNDTAIYKDVVSGNTTYRVWFQPPLTNYPDSTFVLSCQKKTGSNSFAADFVLYSNGKARFGTTTLNPDGSCVFGSNFKTGTAGNFTLGYLKADSSGNLNYGSGAITFSGAGDSGGTTLKVKDGKYRSVITAESMQVVNPSGKYTTIKPTGIIAESLSVSGKKKRIVDTSNYATRSLYCYEMPCPVFGDVGEAALDESGKCIIMIDDIFFETITTDIEYQVFLQKEGKGDAWVEKKENAYFEVSGTPGLKFAWEIKARQKDFETERLEIFDEEDFTDIDYASEAAEMVDNFYKELEVA